MGKEEISNIVMEEKTQPSAKLTRREKDILDILEKHQYDITQIQIGQILGITNVAVSYYEKKLRKKGYLIKDKNRQLTQMEQKVLEIYKQSGYTISQAEIARKLGKTRSRVNQITQSLENKGYNIKSSRPELTDVEQKAVTMIRENNYTISHDNIKEIPYRTIVGLEKKGYNIRGCIIQQLSQRKNEIVNMYEEGDCKIGKSTVRGEITLYPSDKQKLVKTFCSSQLVPQEALRVAKFIKDRHDIVKLLNKLALCKQIAYDNITFLIDELLQYKQEDRTKGIEFVIEYEKILLERGVERVEEPLYQLLVKHKVQLTKSQCLAVKEIIDTYERKIKEEKKVCKEKTENKTQARQQKKQSLEIVEGPEL